MPEITFQRGHTSILIADFYADIMDTLPHATGRGVVQKASALQSVARDAGVMLCYCATVFRPGYPEIGERNKTFRQRKASGQSAIANPIDVIHPGVRPRDGEVVVGKHRVNALYGTDRGCEGWVHLYSLESFGYPREGLHIFPRVYIRLPCSF